MAFTVDTDTTSAFIDKTWLRNQLAERDARQGFTLDQSVSVSQVRAIMMEDGIRPEENEFSREIMRMRSHESA